MQLQTILNAEQDNESFKASHEVIILTKFNNLNDQIRVQKCLQEARKEDDDDIDNEYINIYE